MKIDIRNVMMIFVTGMFLVAGGAARADLAALWRFDFDQTIQRDATVNANHAASAGNVNWVDDIDRGGAMAF